MYAGLFELCVQFGAPAPCYLLRNWVFALSQHLFLIWWLKQQRKQILMHKTCPLTHLSHQREWRSTFSLFMLLLFCSNSCFDVVVVFFFFLVHLSLYTTLQHYNTISCLSVGAFLRLCAQRRGATSTAPTHGAQTKQQDECFLNPTWHRGTPICPCGLTHWLNGSHWERNNGRVTADREERGRTERSGQEDIRVVQFGIPPT